MKLIICIHFVLLVAFQLQGQELADEEQNYKLKTYDLLDVHRISELVDARPDLLIQADNCEGIHIQENEILLFVTTDLKLGKLQVLKIDEQKSLRIKYALYSQSSNESYSHEDFLLKDGRFLDIDNQSINVNNKKELDFKWIGGQGSVLYPQNNIGIFLLKSSQTVSSD